MTTPRCPHCNAQGLKHLTIQSLGSFAVVHCDQCGAIYGVIPVPKEKEPPPPVPVEEKTKEAPRPVPVEKKTPPQPKPPSSPKDDLLKPPDFIQQIGSADLNKKMPYSLDRLAAMARAPGRNVSTMYRHISIDPGPPFCPLCKTEMQQFTIPPGYENSGTRVWVCPTFVCKEWELVDE